MAVTYLDQEIELLVQERKPLPVGWRNQIRLKSKRGHDEQQLDLVGETEHKFRLILRRNSFNLVDFSIILLFESLSQVNFFDFFAIMVGATSTPTI